MTNDKKLFVEACRIKNKNNCDELCLKVQSLMGAHTFAMVKDIPVLIQGNKIIITG